MDNIWAEIDLSAIRHNFRQANGFAGNALFCAVVKDNAYGHGLLPVADALCKEGANFLAVADLSDAAALRKAGFKLPILNLAAILPGQAGEAVHLWVSQSVSDLKIALALSKAALKQKKQALVHIEVDTGMGRLGVLPGDFSTMYARVKKLSNIRLEGVFTHFPSAEKDIKGTTGQAASFLKTVGPCATNILYHCANSAALINSPGLRMDMVRPGLMLYGLYPAGTEKKLKLEPALSLKTRVVQVKKIKKGGRVSYGGTYRAKQDTLLAAIPAGYGDGFSRLLSNRGEVIIRGKKYPVAGRVCMDITMIDLGLKGGIKTGDEVVLIGKQGKSSITAENVAAACGTISYETVCAINKTIERIYIN